ncbi:MAG: GC-type dockerin domain-anchored protein [Planctomycetota bacterium]
MKIRHLSAAALIAASAGLASAQPTVDGMIDVAESSLYEQVWVQNQATGFGNAVAGSFFDSQDGGLVTIGDPQDVTTGVELVIPLSAIGSPSGTIRLFGYINGGMSDFLSNQLITNVTGNPATDFPVNTGNLGDPQLAGPGPGPIDFSSLEYPGTDDGMGGTVTAQPQYFIDINLGALTASTPVLDGTNDMADGYTQVFVQNNYTQFGNSNLVDVVDANGSEIDNVSVAIDGTNLYLFIGGNVQNNGNGLELFLDTGAGGASSIPTDLTADAGFEFAETRIERQGGLTFDTGFTANYAFNIHDSFGGIDVKFADFTTDTVEFIGNFEYANGMNVGVATGGEPGAPAIQITTDNSNGVGVPGVEIGTDLPDIPASPTSPDAEWSYFGSEINNLSAYVDEANEELYIHIGGNLEVNGNKLVLFFDSVPGGQNTIRKDNVDLNFNNLNEGLGALNAGETDVGLTFDAGFTADYVIFYNRSIVDQNVLLRHDGNAALLPTNGARVDVGGTEDTLDYGTFNGGDLNADPVVVFDGPRYDFPGLGNIFSEYAPQESFDGEGIFIPDGDKLEIDLNNSNVAGVTGDMADNAAASAVDTGWEIRISLSELSWFIGEEPQDSLRIAGFISNNEVDFISNQVIGGIDGGPAGNLGNPTNLDLGTVPGDQFVVLIGEDAQPCPADLAAPFGGVLDFFDVLQYLSLFDAEDPAADLAAPMGIFDFFDVLAYLGLFDEGCD